MPIYEYKCSACEKEFELQRKFSDPPLSECPECGKGPVAKLLSRSSFALKGSGWYKSGYAGKKSGDDAKPKGGCGAAGSKSSCSGCPGAE
ncbi:zinc ribbon domain-containing protein [bacterium]|nr:MAG: zinc ribbon domain-containing protein [bacterium]